MKKLFWVVLSGLFIVVLNTAAPATQSAPSTVSASPGDTPTLTCTDGSFIRAYDAAGNVICGRVTGCPYGDSIPLGPQCDRAGADQQAARDQVVVPPVTANGEEFIGK